MAVYKDGAPWVPSNQEELKLYYDSIRNQSLFGPLKAPIPTPPSHFSGVGSGPTISENSPDALMRMIGMRLRSGSASDKFQFATAYKNGDSVVMFFVYDGKPGMMIDAWDMFPSDTLITQIRLLAG